MAGPWVLRAGSWVGWIMVVVGLESGCAVNDRVLLGGGRVRYLANGEGTGRAVVVRTWGVHLVTSPAADAGLTVGRSERAYFYGGAAEGVRVGGDRGGEWVGSAARLEEVGEKVGRAWEVGEPVAWVTRTGGVELKAGRVWGVSVGLRRDAVVELPSRGSTELLLKVSAGRPEGAEVSVRRGNGKETGQ